MRRRGEKERLTVGTTVRILTFFIFPRFRNITAEFGYLKRVTKAFSEIMQKFK